VECIHSIIAFVHVKPEDNADPKPAVRIVPVPVVRLAPLKGLVATNTYTDV